GDERGPDPDHRPRDPRHVGDHMRRHMNDAGTAPPVFDDLTALFRPRSVALVGASDRPHSIGRRTLDNLTIHGDFRGELYLVNPARSEIDGRRCWPSIAALPAAVVPDAAVIVIP